MSYIIIAAAFVVLCIILFLLGKRSIKSYLLVAALAAIAVLLVTFVDFSFLKKDSSEASGNTITTSIKISCETIKGESEYAPENGVVLEKSEIKLSEGASVYDQLVETVKQNKIQFEVNDKIVKGYVAGLAGIYGGDFGDLSGWLFKVNGKFSNLGTNDLKLSEGDFVEWVYTKEMGADVGYESGE